MTDLLVCPFCKSRMEYWIESGFHYGDSGYSPRKCHITCKSCHARTTVIMGDASVEDVLKKWNTRHLDSDIAQSAPTVNDSELVERVADILSQKMPSVDAGHEDDWQLCCDVAAESLRAVNIPAIKAQARREALEEGFLAGEKSMKEKAAKAADLMADTFQKGDGLTASCNILKHIKCIPTGNTEAIRKLLEKEGWS